MKASNDIISWFSNGAASAVATKLMLDARYDVRIILAETNSEHSDNARFRKDCEAWFGQKVEVRHNGKYHDVNDCNVRTKFLRSPQGARCTTELKKAVRHQVEQEVGIEIPQVFGYTVDKKDARRAKKLRDNSPELTIITPLIDRGITKADCFRILQKEGIEPPLMYKLDFPNANCMGCNKAESPYYWLKTKKYFPEVYQERSEQERLVGYALCRVSVNGEQVPVFLDELEEFMTTRHDVPGQMKIPSFSCDFLCT